MRILIVEDENHIRQQLHDAMRAQHYAVDVAEDGREGLYFATEYPYDLAIIDLGLPEISGIELIKQLRSNDKTFPILVLTARSDWQDKVEGLEAGADDYVVKPFQMEEVNARINALLRRSAGSSNPSMNFGPLTINTTAKVALIDSEEMTLSIGKTNALFVATLPYPPGVRQCRKAAEAADGYRSKISLFAIKSEWSPSKPGIFSYLLCTLLCFER